MSKLTLQKYINNLGRYIERLSQLRDENWIAADTADATGSIGQSVNTFQKILVAHNSAISVPRLKYQFCSEMLSLFQKDQMAISSVLDAIQTSNQTVITALFYKNGRFGRLRKSQTEKYLLQACQLLHVTLTKNDLQILKDCSDDTSERQQAIGKIKNRLLSRLVQRWQNSAYAATEARQIEIELFYILSSTRGGVQRDSQQILSHSSDGTTVVSLFPLTERLNASDFNELVYQFHLLISHSGCRNYLPTLLNNVLSNKKNGESELVKQTFVARMADAAKHFVLLAEADSPQDQENKLAFRRLLLTTDYDLAKACILNYPQFLFELAPNWREQILQELVQTVHNELERPQTKEASQSCLEIILNMSREWLMQALSKHTGQTVNDAAIIRSNQTGSARAPRPASMTTQDVNQHLLRETKELVALNVEQQQGALQLIKDYLSRNPNSLKQEFYRKVQDYILQHGFSQNLFDVRFLAEKVFYDTNTQTRSLLDPALLFQKRSRGYQHSAAFKCWNELLTLARLPEMKELNDFTRISAPVVAEQSVIAYEDNSGLGTAQIQKIDLQLTTVAQTFNQILTDKQNEEERQTAGLPKVQSVTELAGASSSSVSNINTAFKDILAVLKNPKQDHTKFYCDINGYCHLEFEGRKYSMAVNMHNELQQHYKAWLLAGRLLPTDALDNSVVDRYNLVVEKLLSSANQWGSILPLHAEIRGYITIILRGLQVPITKLYPSGNWDKLHNAIYKRLNLAMRRLFQEALGKAFDTNNNYLDISRLNAMLDVQRLAMAQIARNILFDICRREIPYFDDKLEQLTTEHADVFDKAEQYILSGDHFANLTATTLPITQIDRNAAMMLTFAGTEVTSYVKQTEKTAAIPIEFHALRDDGSNIERLSADPSPLKVMVRTPALLSNSPFNEAVLDIAAKLKTLYGFTRQSATPRVYYLLTSVYGFFKRVIDRQNQNRISQLTIAGAHEFNRQRLFTSIEAPVEQAAAPLINLADLCLIQNIGVDEHGSNLDDLAHSTVIKEATLMAQMALLATFVKQAQHFPPALNAELAALNEQAVQHYKTFLWTSSAAKNSQHRYASLFSEYGPGQMLVYLFKDTRQRIFRYTINKLNPRLANPKAVLTELISLALLTAWSSERFMRLSMGKWCQAFAIYLQDQAFVGGDNTDKHFQIIAARVHLLKQLALNANPEVMEDVKSKLCDFINGPNNQSQNDLTQALDLLHAQSSYYKFSTVPINNQGMTEVIKSFTGSCYQDSKLDRMEADIILQREQGSRLAQHHVTQSLMPQHAPTALLTTAKDSLSLENENISLTALKVAWQKAPYSEEVLTAIIQQLDNWLLKHTPPIGTTSTPTNTPPSVDERIDAFGNRLFALLDSQLGRFLEFLNNNIILLTSLLSRYHKNKPQTAPAQLLQLIQKIYQAHHAQFSQHQGVVSRDASAIVSGRTSPARDKNELEQSAVLDRLTSVEDTHQHDALKVFWQHYQSLLAMDENVLCQFIEDNFATAGFTESIPLALKQHLLPRLLTSPSATNLYPRLTNWLQADKPKSEESSAIINSQRQVAKNNRSSTTSGQQPPVFSGIMDITGHWLTVVDNDRPTYLYCEDRVEFSQNHIFINLINAAVPSSDIAKSYQSIKQFNQDCIYPLALNLLRKWELLISQYQPARRMELRNAQYFGLTEKIYEAYQTALKEAWQNNSLDLKRLNEALHKAEITLTGQFTLPPAQNTSEVSAAPTASTSVANNGRTSSIASFEHALPTDFVAGARPTLTVTPDRKNSLTIIKTNQQYQQISVQEYVSDVWRTTETYAYVSETQEQSQQSSDPQVKLAAVPNSSENVVAWQLDTLPQVTDPSASTSPSKKMLTELNAHFAHSAMPVAVYSYSPKRQINRWLNWENDIRNIHALNFALNDPTLFTEDSFGLGTNLPHYLFIEAASVIPRYFQNARQAREIHLLNQMGMLGILVENAALLPANLRLSLVDRYQEVLRLYTHYLAQHQTNSVRDKPIVYFSATQSGQLATKLMEDALVFWRQDQLKTLHHLKKDRRSSARRALNDELPKNSTKELAAKILLNLMATKDYLHAQVTKLPINEFMRSLLAVISSNVFLGDTSGKYFPLFSLLIANDQKEDQIAILNNMNHCMRNYIRSPSPLTLKSLINEFDEHLAKFTVPPTLGEQPTPTGWRHKAQLFLGLFSSVRRESVSSSEEAAQSSPGSGPGGPPS